MQNGKTVIVPEKDICYYEWKGTGYMVVTPETGEAAYMISGGLCGGSVGSGSNGSGSEGSGSEGGGSDGFGSEGSGSEGGQGNDSHGTAGSEQGGGSGDINGSNAEGHGGDGTSGESGGKTGKDNGSRTSNSPNHDYWKAVAEKYGVDIARKFEAFGEQGKQVLEAYGDRAVSAVKNLSDADSTKAIQLMVEYGESAVELLNKGYSVSGARSVIEGGSVPNYEVTWNKSIKATQEMIEGTNIPKSFTIKGQYVNGKEVRVHGNATKHMGEYVNSANGSLLVENELMISFQDTVLQILPKVQSGRNFFYINGWEIGINGDTGVIYHALYK